MPRTTFTRRVTVAVTALALGAGVAATTATPASALTTAGRVSVSRFDTHLLADINTARRNHGLRPLVLAAGTTDIAHGWSCHLASARELSHNLRLGSQLPTHGSRLWTFYAENVGYVWSGSGAHAMFEAYMHSAPHRANILDPSARYVGLWTKKSGSFRWNTIDFVGNSSSSYSTSYGAAHKTC